MDFESYADRLTAADVRNVEFYRRKLVCNSGTPTVLRDLLSEASAALMFRNADFLVEMGDSPDLTLRAFGEIVCAEVKHFRRKQQDDVDGTRLAKADECLVQYGDTVQSEGSAAWDQVAAVVQRKAAQYRPGVPNILVLDSSSPHGVDDAIMPTAINIIDEIVEHGGDPGLAKLNGVVL